MTTSPSEPAVQVRSYSAPKMQLLRIIVGLILLFQAGCFNASPDDQELPWSRPADWEGGVPGMGN